MIGRLALVLTLSSSRSSRRVMVDVCSKISCGVVTTILREEDDRKRAETPRRLALLDRSFGKAVVEAGFPILSEEKPEQKRS